MLVFATLFFDILICGQEVTASVDPRVDRVHICFRDNPARCAPVGPDSFESQKTPKCCWEKVPFLFGYTMCALRLISGIIFIAFYYFKC